MDRLCTGTNALSSIREFCELSMPILMFDKDGKFVVMRLEQVRIMPLRLQPKLMFCSYFHYLSAPKLYLLQDLCQLGANLFKQRNMYMRI
jgi:hypothetical protein